MGNLFCGASSTSLHVIEKEVKTECCLWRSCVGKLGDIDDLTLPSYESKHIKTQFPDQMLVPDLHQLVLDYLGTIQLWDSNSRDLSQVVYPGRFDGPYERIASELSKPNTRSTTSHSDDQRILNWLFYPQRPFLRDLKLGDTHVVVDRYALTAVKYPISIVPFLRLDFPTTDCLATYAVSIMCGLSIQINESTTTTLLLDMSTGRWNRRLETKGPGIRELGYDSCWSSCPSTPQKLILVKSVRLEWCEENHILRVIRYGFANHTSPLVHIDEHRLPLHYDPKSSFFVLYSRYQDISFNDEVSPLYSRLKEGSASIVG